MSNQSIDILYDTYETGGDDLKKHGFTPTANENALYTERRRKMEDKLISPLSSS